MQVESLKRSSCHKNGVELLSFTQPCTNITSQRYDLDIGAQGQQLRGASD
jgi:hypothetical protein